MVNNKLNRACLVVLKELQASEFLASTAFKKLVDG